MKNKANLFIFCILMIISTSIYSQVNGRDIVFDWRNCSDNEWMDIDSSFQKFTPSIIEVKM